jgi:hypothetical protein
MSQLDRVLERVRQNRTRELGTPDRNSTTVSTPEARIGLRFTPGSRVFDRHTGEEGVVIGGSRENVIVAAPERADG